MTPVGHASVSYLLGHGIPWLPMGAVVIGGLAPDIDYILYLYPWFPSIHRVLTHNILFVLAISLPALFLAGPGTRLRIASGLFIGGMLHLLADACLDNNPSNGIGVAILWPFSNVFFSPFNLLDPTVTSSWWPDVFPRRMNVLLGFAWDLPLIAAAGIIFFKRRKIMQAGG